MLYIAGTSDRRKEIPVLTNIARIPRAARPETIPKISGFFTIPKTTFFALGFLPSLLNIERPITAKILKAGTITAESRVATAAPSPGKRDEARGIPISA